MLKVAVVANIQSSRESLQRRVGGILKNIAIVKQVLETDLVKEQPDLIIAHHLGGRIDKLRRELNTIPIVPVKLSLLPIGLKTLMTLIKDKEKVAIIAQHHHCANMLLSEIINRGISNCRFITGTFEEMSDISTDKFITSEEMLDYVPPDLRSDPRLITVPRMISPQSVTEILSATLDIASTSRGVRVS